MMENKKTSLQDFPQKSHKAWEIWRKQNLRMVWGIWQKQTLKNIKIFWKYVFKRGGNETHWFINNSQKRQQM